MVSAFVLAFVLIIALYGIHHESDKRHSTIEKVLRADLQPLREIVEKATKL